MKYSHLKTTALLLGVLFSGMNAAVAAPVTYKIDAAHSFANWSVRHVVAKASGTFNEITGNISIDADNLANSSVDAKINVLSVNSGLAKRDAHIKEKDYLNAGQFAEMRFVSTKIEAKSATEGMMAGKFTMNGVTKEIVLPFKVLGFGNDPWGGERSGFEAKTSLKASDYGFGWGVKQNAPVGDDIEVTLLIEAVKPSAEKPKK
ncbi:YceI family protein [Methylotenera sp.]|uniref:YceI family protein n=1 Tax=Methylotenera sp. TaxID=2051956 RepID=UPI002735F88A|nr:YceI family protein [Methylotenera sp.]MDP3776032.1 YceI family protein [Methylotenera sp.]